MSTAPGPVVPQPVAAEANQRRSVRTPYPALLHGVLCGLSGLTLFAAAGLAGLACMVAGAPPQVLAAVHLAHLASAGLVWLGIALVLLDLFVLLPGKRRIGPTVRFVPPANRALTVVLTAYNDELSIGAAVDDFRAHPLVRRVIVVDNNSGDATAAVAAAHGAAVVREVQPGYGHCVYRALTEGLQAPDTELTLLCEGDRTFRAYDIDKFLAYIAHADIVNGTRIVEQLRERDTQLTLFMYYGNFFVGKLLEAKHIGKGTFTDVGTTYKLCRNEALRRLLPELNPQVNLEFNAHFLDRALQQSVELVECPVTFHQRVGQSKGGNTGNLRALTVGLRMMKGLIWKWSPSA